jgi:hypothetical protein
VICAFICCLIGVTLPRGKNSFAVQINNNNDNNHIFELLATSLNALQVVTYTVSFSTLRMHIFALPWND